MQNQLQLELNNRGVEVRIQIDAVLRRIRISYFVDLSQAMALQFGSWRNQMRLMYGHPLGEVSVIFPVSSRIYLMDLDVLVGPHHFALSVTPRDL